MVEGWSVFSMGHTVLHPVYTSDNMHEEAEAKWAKKSPQNIFNQVANIVDSIAVHIEGNLNVFPHYLQCICSMHYKCEMINITDITMRRVYSLKGNQVHLN